MTSRISSPDTAADIELRSILDEDTLSGFVVTAGAGSGKTTSLVKALAHVVSVHGDDLRARTQRVACITYTEVAANEIHSDVENDPLVMVSTIHSFLWGLAKPFQRDIRAWTKSRVESRIAELKAKQDGYTARTKATTVDKDTVDLVRLTDQLSKIDGVEHFTYELASDYARGILGHEDILNLAPELIMAKPLLASIVARQFPYIFVDESQDTFTNVVECLIHVREHAKGTVSLGFFGDPMQQIYQRSTGDIEVRDGWKVVEKPENFRSSVQVLKVVNAVRAAGDGLVQVAGGSPKNLVEGESFFFVLPADSNRTQYLEAVRSWLNDHSTAGSWSADNPDEGAKILMIVHRMAAKRLGFENLFAAFNDSGSRSLKEAFEDGSAWPVRPFTDVILPLCEAGEVDSPEVIAVLRRHSALLRSTLSSEKIRENLKASREAVQEVRNAVAIGGAGSVGTVLKMAVAAGLTENDARLEAYFEPESSAGDVVLSETVIKTMDAFLACDVKELGGYRRYVDDLSPYSTQHGTKGSEFRKVIVVLDDDEGSYNLYSYDKILGIKPLSETDKKNQAAGVDSAIERTRRLLYVCVSRAIESLAVVIFASGVEAAAAALKDSGISGQAPIHTLADLA